MLASAVASQGTAAPTHNAAEGTVFFDRTADKFYINSSGSTTWQLIGGSGVSGPGGSTTQLQYNNASSFGGTVGVTWNNATSVLTMTSATHLVPQGAGTTSIQIGASCFAGWSNSIVIGDTLGAAAPAGGQNNLLIGNNFGSTITGTGNVFIIMDSGPAGGAGDINIGIGYQVLTGLTDGSGNAVLGRRAGLNIGTGSNNICIGQGADVNSDGNGAIAIGDSATADPGAITIGQFILIDSTGDWYTDQPNTAQNFVRATQFDKTVTTLDNAAVCLTKDLDVNSEFWFRSVLHITGSAIGGYKIAVRSTGSSSIVFQITAINNATGATTISTRKTTSGQSGESVTGTEIFATVEGYVTTGAVDGVTLDIQFAQSVANGTSSVLVGSTLVVQKL